MIHVKIQVNCMKKFIFSIKKQVIKVQKKIMLLTTVVTVFISKPCLIKTSIVREHMYVCP